MMADLASTSPPGSPYIFFERSTQASQELGEDIILSWATGVGRAQGGLGGLAGSSHSQAPYGTSQSSLTIDT